MDYYRFKTEKYRKATRHLDTFQHGCYRLLIDEYMITGEPLPDNDQALANICHCTLQAFLEHASSIVRAFFTPKDGLLFHDYCNDELDFQDTRRRFASEKAQKAAKARYNKNKDLDATSIQQECLAMPESRVKSQDIPSNEDIDSVDPPKKENRFEEWWSMFPKQRAGAKEKARSAYAKAIKRAAEDEIHEGTIRYIGSDEVARGFAKGAAAWLNDDRWRTQYRPANGGNDPNGGGSGQGRAGGNGREPRGVVAAALRVAARLEGKDQNDG